jgi:hypothetical protein
MKTIKLILTISLLFITITVQAQFLVDKFKEFPLRTRYIPQTNYTAQVAKELNKLFPRIKWNLAQDPIFSLYDKRKNDKLAASYGGHPVLVFSDFEQYAKYVEEWETPEQQEKLINALVEGSVPYLPVYFEALHDKRPKGSREPFDYVSFYGEVINTVKPQMSDEEYAELKLEQRYAPLAGLPCNAPLIEDLRIWFPKFQWKNFKPFDGTFPLFDGIKLLYCGYPVIAFTTKQKYLDYLDFFESEENKVTMLKLVLKRKSPPIYPVYGPALYIQPNDESPNILDYIKKMKEERIFPYLEGNN